MLWGTPARNTHMGDAVYERERKKGVCVVTSDWCITGSEFFVLKICMKVS